jgi:hypothetical protein
VRAKTAKWPRGRRENNIVISVPSEEGCGVLGRARKKKDPNLPKKRKIHI